MRNNVTPTLKHAAAFSPVGKGRNIAVSLPESDSENVHTTLKHCFLSCLFHLEVTLRSGRSSSLLGLREQRRTDGTLHHVAQQCLCLFVFQLAVRGTSLARVGTDDFRHYYLLFVGFRYIYIYRIFYLLSPSYMCGIPIV